MTRGGDEQGAQLRLVGGDAGRYGQLRGRVEVVGELVETVKGVKTLICGS